MLFILYHVIQYSIHLLFRFEPFYSQSGFGWILFFEHFNYV